MNNATNRPTYVILIFEQGDEQVYEENGVQDALNNPYVLMGMVLKGLENYSIMDMMYKKRYPEQYNEVRDTIKYKYYNRLYKYLSRIQLGKLEDVYKIGESYNSESVFISLEGLKMFFQDIEQYEKCAVIKKYQDLLIDNLPHKLEI